MVLNLWGSIFSIWLPRRDFKVKLAINKCFLNTKISRGNSFMEGEVIPKMEGHCPQLQRYFQFGIICILLSYSMFVMWLLLEHHCHIFAGQLWSNNRCYIWTGPNLFDGVQVRTNIPVFWYVFAHANWLVFTFCSQSTRDQDFRGMYCAVLSRKLVYYFLLFFLVYHCLLSVTTLCVELMLTFLFRFWAFFFYSI